MKLVLLAAVVPCLWAQNFDAQAVERGEKAFVSSCGFCHGDDATGSRGPDLVRSPLVNKDVNGNLIGPVIRNGRPDKEMPAFPQMTAPQIADIVQFLHSQVIAALHSARVPGDYPLAKLLTGNAESGKRFFSGAGGCEACHSPSGDLAGIARKLKPIDLQSRMLYPSGRGAPPQLTAVVTLSSGEKIEGRVAHIDEFNVAIRDSQGWYRSFPRTAVKVEVRDALAAHKSLLARISDSEMHDLFAYLETLQ